jgi:Phage tail sheath protein subtilisin-like domain/Phage tail sheath C-terminal domain
MPIQLSPSVVVQEKDLTNVIPAVSSSIGAAVINAGWGPVMDVTTVDSENALVSAFGKPNASNAASWFTAANFLAYSNNLLAIRSDTNGQRNAVATPTGSVDEITFSSGGTGWTTATVNISAPNTSGGTQATATATISGGVVTEITVTEPGSGYTLAPTVTVTGTYTTGVTSPVASIKASSGIKVNNDNDYLLKYASNSTSVVGEFVAKYPGTLGNSLTVSMADYNTFAAWAYKSYFNGTPGTSTYAARTGASNDEIHVVVVDRLGAFTGTAGTVLETFAYASKASDAKKEDGTASYYKDVVNNTSKYVRWLAHPSVGANWGTVAGSTTFAALTSFSRDLSGGLDDYSATDGALMNAFALLNSDEQFDVNLIMCGKSSTTVAKYVLDNIAEVRKDCMVFISPYDTTTGNPVIGTDSSLTDKLIAYKNGTNINSSYAVFDSGYKYQYDRYNDQYRWVPLNGDVAGLCARTDETDDPWFSPAGLNRGQIKNVVRLAFNPRKTDRDNLYSAGINPVVSFPGQGVVLYGDKTALAKPSAFDRINVRRLFIVLEKAIATASKYQLFEFNDGFTRAQFRNMVEPFLRDVKGRRGVYDFKVVCDESNNTSEVVDTNRFVADIYIKPARSINFIQLNFIATRSGADFNEIAG